MSLAQFARVFLLFFMPSCAALLAAGGGGLRLVCDVEGRALEVAKVVNGQIMLAGGGGEIAAPKGAKWRLEGGLRENAALLDVSPTYGIYRKNPHDDDSAGKLPMEAYCLVRHRLPKGGDNGSPFLMRWPKGVKTEALAVMVWVIGDQAAKVEARAIPKEEFVARVEWPLTEDEALKGRAVALLWAEGRFVAPRPWCGGGATRQEAEAAVLFDDADGLRKLIARGLNVAAVKNKREFTLLHLAAEAGSVGALDALLRSAPQLVSAAGWSEGVGKQTPLHWSAGKGRAEAVKHLLDAKADANAQTTSIRTSRQSTPLFSAVLNGHREAARLLLEAGEKTGGKGWRVEELLDVAIEGGDCVMAELLLGRTAPGGKLPAVYNNGHVLRISLRKRRMDAVVWLLKHGAMINSENLWDSMPHSVAKTTGRTVVRKLHEVDPGHGVLRGILEMAGCQDDEDFSALVFGACGGFVNRSCCSVHQQIRAAALSVSTRAGYTHLARRFLDAGYPSAGEFMEGKSALHYAAEADRVDVARLLLARGVDPGAVDHSGATPLDRALLNGAAAVARLLAERGARIDPASVHADDLLNAAIRLDLAELAAAACASGLPKGGRLYGAWTPMDAARFYKSEKCLAALPDTGAGDKSGEKDIPIVDASVLDAPVAVVHAGQARDPRSPFALGKEMTVQVRALCEPSGNINLCGVIDQDAPPEMREAAIKEARKMKVRSPLSKGKPVAAAVTFPVVFAAGGEDVFELSNSSGGSGVKEPPVAVHQPAPYYPDNARGKENGEVVVSFIVSKDGQTEAIDVVRASSLTFADSAGRTVKHWRFTPGKVNGAPVRMRVSMPIGFQLGP